jgi:hypothetical protein
MGCARHASRASVAQRAKPIRRAAPTQVEWGPEAAGLQCRLRPVKRVFPAGESPAFKVDLRNRGGRVFAFVKTDQAPLEEFAIDGRWRPWPDRPPTDGKIVAFGPGVEFPDLPLTLPANAQSDLVSGPHVVQVAFSFEGIEVVSNPVEIEIVGR